MYVAQRMSAMVPPTLSLSQLGRRVKDARYAAGVVQRLYQVHFWQVDNNNPDSDLRKQALALQRDFWELKKEYETFEQHGDPKELASRPAARLATNFAKLCADVGRVKWYEEDAHSNAQRVRQLELELSAAKQKIEDLEVRHAKRTAELLAEIERNESKYQEACGDNIQLYDETAPAVTAPADITIYLDDYCGYDASPGVTGYPTLYDACTSDELLLANRSYSDVINPVTCDGDDNNAQGSFTITRTWSTRAY